MHQVYGGDIFTYFAKLVRELPPLNALPHTQIPKLKQLHTADEESYLLSIEWGPYGLTAMSFLTDPYKRVFFDFESTVTLISLAVENAITEYDTGRAVLIEEVGTE